MTKGLAILLAACALMAACGAEPDRTPVSTTAAYSIESYTDPARQSWDGAGPRPLTTVVWYAAAEAAPAVPVMFPDNQPIFDAGPLHRDAPAAAGKRALIIVSHGTGGSALQMSWLARRLVGEGFIVAGVHHHGNTAAEDRFDPRGFRMPWERARDVSVLIDALLADDQWAPLIDETRIGAAGFSLGGYTVLAAAGGRLDLARLAAFCRSPARDATCDEQPEYPTAGAEFESLLASDPVLQERMKESGMTFTDGRIKAAIAIAPALGQAFTPDSLAMIEVPVLLATGTNDTTTPRATNADAVLKYVPGAKSIDVAKAGHLTFLNPCTPRGLKYVPACKDGDGVARDDIHEDLASRVSAFFQIALHD